MTALTHGQGSHLKAGDSWSTECIEFKEVRGRAGLWGRGARLQTSKAVEVMGVRKECGQGVGDKGGAAWLESVRRSKAWIYISWTLRSIEKQGGIGKEVERLLKASQTSEMCCVDQGWDKGDHGLALGWGKRCTEQDLGVWKWEGIIDETRKQSPLWAHRKRRRPITKD